MKQVILIVLDGFGLAEPGPGNAITLAKPTHFYDFQNRFPHGTLTASGESVGLPTHEVGSTEVGHINMGAGYVVYQDLPRINMSIADGSFYKNGAFMGAIRHIQETGGKLHLMGLVGEGSVHSSLDHLFALLYLAKENKVDRVFVHAITDGRDSPPQCASEVLTRLQDKLTHLGTGKIATVMGRYYAMDRDLRWNRTERAYRCLTEAVGNKAPDFIKAVEDAYKNHKTDEFIEPTVIVENDLPVAKIESGDAVIFFNYRIDRPRQLTKAFVLDNFAEDANLSLSFDPYAVKYYKTHHPKEEMVAKPFERGSKISNIYFVTMTEYAKGLDAHSAFPPTIVENPIGKVIAASGASQLRLAESEKERFVTYYFDGHHEQSFSNCDVIIVPSPKVPTYDLKPEMSAAELTEILTEKVASRDYDFILVNYANADMVGHTGNLNATIEAITVLDNCLSKIVDLALSKDYAVIITADHGNAEQKLNLTSGTPSTEHTGNPVPIIIIDREYEGKKVTLSPGILADLAPTILHIMDIPKPTQMTGRNLLYDRLNLSK